MMQCMEYINVPNDGGHGLKFGSKKYSIHNLNCSSPLAYKAGPLQHKHVPLFFQIYKLNMKYKKYRNVFFFFFFLAEVFFFFSRFSFLRGHRILNIHIILNYISENESKLVRDPTLVLYNEKRFFFFFFSIWVQESIWRPTSVSLWSAATNTKPPKKIKKCTILFH